jgi:hypothetical protein
MVAPSIRLSRQNHPRQSLETIFFGKPLPNHNETILVEFDRKQKDHVELPKWAVAVGLVGVKIKGLARFTPAGFRISHQDMSSECYIEVAHPAPFFQTINRGHKQRLLSKQSEVNIMSVAHLIHRCGRIPSIPTIGIPERICMWRNRAGSMHFGIESPIRGIVQNFFNFFLFSTRFENSVGADSPTSFCSR